MVNTLNTIKNFTKASGVKSILQTRARLPKTFDFGSMKIVTPDKYISTTPKNKVPRFLYHITSKDNYISMMKDRELKASKHGGEAIKGVFMLELNNFLKTWGKPKGLKINLQEALLLNQADQGGEKLVVLRIPTKNLDSDALLIRSQKELGNARKNEFFQHAKETFKKRGAQPHKDLEHIFSGDKARNARIYNNRKEPIEYIYPRNINSNDFEKIGETTIAPMHLKKLFLNLFKGTPEEQAIKKLFPNRTYTPLDDIKIEKPKIQIADPRSIFAKIKSKELASA